MVLAAAVRSSDGARAAGCALYARFEPFKAGPRASGTSPFFLGRWHQPYERPFAASISAFALVTKPFEFRELVSKSANPLFLMETSYP
jgi:hypothetical protein